MNILTDFQMLGGVRHSSLIHKDRLVLSDFPALFNENILKAARIFSQMLEAIQPMEESHNEVQMEMDDSRLLGFKLDEDTQLILMTDPAINQALISTAIRSATKKLLLQAHAPVETTAASTVASPSAIQEKSKASAQSTDSAAKPDPVDLKPTLKHIIRLLSEQVGPAAQILFKREYVIWANEGEVSSYRLPLLTSRIASFIEHPEKRSHFLLGSSDLINAAPTTESPDAIH